MLTVKPHMTQMGVFLRTFFSHLVDPNKQFGIHEKIVLGSASHRPVGTFMSLFVVLLHTPRIKNDWVNSEWQIAGK